MNLLQLLASSMCLTLPAVVRGQIAAYSRPLAMTYINNHSIQLDYSPQQLQQYIYEAGITQLSSFLLNVPSVESQYDTLLRNLSKNGVALFPAIGDAMSTGYPINSKVYMDVAQFYRQYTSSIVITDAQGYVSAYGGISDIRSMIRYLTNSLNFTHIQMNPWPRDNTTGHAPFTFPGYPQVDSSVEQVQLNQADPMGTPPNYTILPDPTNWLPNTVEVDEILNVNSSIQVLINYENPPEQAGLAQDLNSSQQEAAFTQTIQAIQSNFSSSAYSGRVHWLPPWTKTYDPVVQNTWSFIMSRLAKYS